MTTPEEFEIKMQEIKNTTEGDKEMAHGKMDDLMAQVLVELGYGKGIDIFESQDKWYS